MPACWKVAKLSPIHKKGEVLNPGNYWMIAVSGVIYRIFANVLEDLVTDWCMCERGQDSRHAVWLLPGQKHSTPSVYSEAS